MVVKNGFSLLELVVTIVIIGISVASIPSLFSISQKGNQNTLLQEVIASSTSKISEINLYPWNSAQTDTFDAPVIKSSQSKETKDFKYFYNPRAVSDIEAAKISKTDPNKRVGINQFDGAKGKVDVVEASDSKNILSLEYKVKVNYIEGDITEDPNANNGKLKANFDPEKPENGTTDGLMVEITTEPKFENGKVDKNNGVTLRAYSFNIGSTADSKKQSFIKADFR